VDPQISHQRLQSKQIGVAGASTGYLLQENSPSLVVCLFALIPALSFSYSRSLLFIFPLSLFHIPALPFSYSRSLLFILTFLEAGRQLEARTSGYTPFRFWARWYV
jgi:hypothetical protein